MNRILFLFLCTSISLSLHAQSAITYELNGGRFGDNLKSYAQAKWLSYISSLPFLYTSFDYSDQLMMHVNETECTDDIKKNFSKIRRLPSHNYSLKKNKNWLYISTFYTKMSINWSDQQFINELRNHISPRCTIEKIAIPEECISVAIHIRTGGGYSYDNAHIQKKFPLRFAPKEFYIDQLRYLTEKFSGKQLYVHIFTDHLNPEELVDIFKNEVDNKNIIYGYRENGNSHNCNIIQDFFTMMEFDCLIRPGSNFSRFVERIGNNKLVIYPTEAQFTSPHTWVISAFQIRERTNNGWDITKKRNY